MRRRTNKELDPVLAKIAKESADECEILTSQMIEAYYILMELVVQKIRKKVPVLLPNMGYFYISPYKIEKRFERMFKSMRNRQSGKDPNGMTREEVKAQVEKYWPFVQASRTHLIRRGKRYKAELKRLAEKENGTSGQKQNFSSRG